MWKSPLKMRFRGVAPAIRTAFECEYRADGHGSGGICKGGETRRPAICERRTDSCGATDRKLGHCSPRGATGNLREAATATRDELEIEIVRSSVRVADGGAASPRDRDICCAPTRRIGSESGEVGVKMGDGLDAAEVVFEGDVFVGSMGVFVGQAKANQDAGDFESVIHLRNKGD